MKQNRRLFCLSGIWAALVSLFKSEAPAPAATVTWDTPAFQLSVPTPPPNSLLKCCYIVLPTQASQLAFGSNLCSLNPLLFWVHDYETNELLPLTDFGFTMSVGDPCPMVLLVRCEDTPEGPKKFAETRWLLGWRVSNDKKIVEKTPVELFNQGLK